MGAFELILILAVVMIVFGAGKLPSVMKDLGKGVKAFRDGMSDEHKSDVPPASTPINTVAPGAAPPTPVSPPLPPTE